MKPYVSICRVSILSIYDMVFKNARPVMTRFVTAVERLESVLDALLLLDAEHIDVCGIAPPNSTPVGMSGVA